MSDEIQVRASLQIRAGQLIFQSNPTGFNADMATAVPNGPTPGSLSVPLAGINVDLSQLTTPGMCFLYNVGTGDTDTDDLGNSFVEYGMFDPTTAVHEFIPLGEILPGEGYVLRLSRFLGHEMGTTAGTGTTGQNSVLRLKAVGAVQHCQVFVFER